MTCFKVLCRYSVGRTEDTAINLKGQSVFRSNRAPHDLVCSVDRFPSPTDSFSYIQGDLEKYGESRTEDPQRLFATFGLITDSYFI
jgi:hypothetical protein